MIHVRVVNFAGDTFSTADIRAAVKTLEEHNVPPWCSE